MSDDEAKTKIEAYKEREDCLERLVNATQALQSGRSAVSSVASRYARVEAYLGILEEQVMEALGTGHAVDHSSQITFDVKVFEIAFLDLLWVMTEDRVRAQDLVDHYKTL